LQCRYTLAGNYLLYDTPFLKITSQLIDLQFILNYIKIRMFVNIMLIYKLRFCRLQTYHKHL